MHLTSFSWEWTPDETEMESSVKRAQERLIEARLELAAAEHTFTKLTDMMSYSMLASRNVVKGDRIAIEYSDSLEVGKFLDIERGILVYNRIGSKGKLGVHKFYVDPPMFDAVRPARDGEVSIPKGKFNSIAKNRRST